MHLSQRVRAGSWTAPERPVETTEVLYFRYHAYRRRQAAELLRIMPREAVRDLYGRARDWARDQGLHDGRDPMASLQKFAEHLLPLPPFEVWLEDRGTHPLAHIEENSDGPYAPPVGRPGRVETRVFRHGGRRWDSSLLVFREGEAWKGFLEFQEREGGPTYKTATIFREDSAAEVRLRFCDFSDDALSAFLLSALS